MILSQRDSHNTGQSDTFPNREKNLMVNFSYFYIFLNRKFSQKLKENCKIEGKFMDFHPGVVPKIKTSENKWSQHVTYRKRVRQLGLTAVVCAC